MQDGPWQVTSAKMLPAMRSLLPLALLPTVACSGPTASVEELLDRHVQALGGRAAHERLHNRVTRGRAELRGFPDHDWTATFVRYEAAPGFWSETLTFADWENEEGTNGEFAWGYGHVKYPSIEHRLKAEWEAVDLVHLTVFNGHLSWRDRYATVRLAGVRTIEGRECQEIVLTPPRGNPVTWYLDVESHLIAKTEANVGGTIIETFLDDYREVDGVLLPHRVNRLMAGGGPGPSIPFLRPGPGKQDLLVIVDSVRHDIDEADGGFEPPSAIRELQEGNR